jgi:hypothetical protein
VIEYTTDQMETIAQRVIDRLLIQAASRWVVWFDRGTFRMRSSTTFAAKDYHLIVGTYNYRVTIEMIVDDMKAFYAERRKPVFI